MSTQTLPAWDMTPIFPSLQSPEFETEFASALAAISDLAALFEQYRVNRRDTSAVDAEFVAQWENVAASLNELLARLETLGSYIGCFVTTDAQNETAKARESEMETRAVALGQLETRLVAWIGSSDIDALLQQSEVARAHEFWVRARRFWPRTR